MELRADFARRGWDVVAYLGSGEFGDLYLVTDRRRGLTQAVKRSKLPVKQSGVLMEYIEMIDLYSHHVVLPHDAWIDLQGRVSILMDYCDGGNLNEYMEGRYPLPEERLLSIVTQLLLGLDHIHKKGKIHRDIKPENILLDFTQGRGKEWPLVKLGDFGLTRCISRHEPRARSQIGTPLYMPPEMLEGGYPYTSKADLWSLGVVVYRLMTNKMPFPFDSIDEYRRSRARSPPPHPCTCCRYSQALGDCVMTMLCWSWKLRPRAHALLQCIVFRNVLRLRPWMPLSPPVSLCAFVESQNSSLDVHEGPTERAKVMHTLTFGDQVYLSSDFPRRCSRRERWLPVVYPYPGYIRTADAMRHAFGFYAPDERVTPENHGMRSTTTSRRRPSTFSNSEPWRECGNFTISSSS